MVLLTSLARARLANRLRVVKARGLRRDPSGQAIAAACVRCGGRMSVVGGTPLGSLAARMPARHDVAREVGRGRTPVPRAPRCPGPALRGRAALERERERGGFRCEDGQMGKRAGRGGRHGRRGAGGSNGAGNGRRFIATLRREAAAAAVHLQRLTSKAAALWAARAAEGGPVCAGTRLRRSASQRRTSSASTGTPGTPGTRRWRWRARTTRSTRATTAYGGA